MFLRVSAALVLMAACSSEAKHPPPVDADSARDKPGESVRDSAVDASTSLIPFDLPEALDLRGAGAPSSVAIADLDGDQYLDLVALVPQNTQPGAVTAVIAYGAESPFTSQFPLTLMGLAPVDPGGFAGSRDTADVLALIDFDADGRTDVVTAWGWFKNVGPKQFALVAFDEGAAQLYQPVSMLRRNGELVAVRGTVAGVVETCDPSGACVPLAGQESIVCPPDTFCAVEDLAVADFDHDGEDDVLAGGPPVEEPFIEGSRLWRSSTEWKAPIFVEQMHTVDYETGDIDGDGFADLVAQQRELISDFPSNTDIWISDPLAPSGFRKTQTLSNADNHTDNAELADADGDGCLDLMMIGVDESQVALRLGRVDGDGCSETLGDADPVSGWRLVQAVNAIGIQQLDVNGDGRAEWVLRDAETHLLRFMTIPDLR